MITANSWLLLLLSLPTNRNTERVAVWRRLKKMGAVQIKTSTYLLPDTPAQGTSSSNGLPNRFVIMEAIRRLFVHKKSRA